VPTVEGGGVSPIRERPDCRRDPGGGAIRLDGALA
jgi:hypothetical protein